MKFHEMKEGKEYNGKAVNGTTYKYKIKNGLLWLCGEGFSKLTAKYISTMEFTEFLPYDPADYKTFEEAVEHMRKGGHCFNLYTGIPTSLHSSLQTKWYIHQNALMWLEHDVPRSFMFNIDYLEPKWILL